MRTRSVAAIVPSWNSMAFLPRCLGSLGEQEPEVGLLVVDNGSSDGSLEYLKREGFSHLPLPRNVGFAAAVDLGAARVAAPYVLVLNSDTVLEPGCIRLLAEALDADPSLGGVQPRILQLEEEDKPPFPIDSARIYSVGQSLTRDGRAFETGAGEIQRQEHLARREVFGVCGAACLLRRELFDDLGGYDERYFAFYEDVDLNVRAQIAGWRFECVPEAVIWHVGNASWKQGFERPNKENARLVARNRLATQVKFMPLGMIPRIVLVEVGSLLRAARERRFLSTLRGKLSVLRWLPNLIAERRCLNREGDLARARAWLA